MTTTMNVYRCKDHDLHYPVGGGSIVIAPNVVKARQLLDAVLIKRGLKPYREKRYTLVRIDISVASAHVIADGNY